MIKSKDPHVIAQRLPLATALDPIRPHDDAGDRRAPVLAWQAHVAAGRIGAITPIAPEQLANLAATERALGTARPRGGAVW